MLRRAIFVATILATGCRTSTTPPKSPRVDAVDDAALRVRVARAEARRADGVNELVELATGKDPHARELALRGLGRTGGAKASAVLHNAMVDEDPRVIAAALGAIGIAGALDDALVWTSEDDAVRLLTFHDPGVRTAAAEALGRAGSAKVQPALASCVTSSVEAASCALALGRHGRRKLALSNDARQALVAATASRDPATRYAAVYALAREHDAQPDGALSAALVTRITDEVAEIRATAIAGLAKHKSVDAGRAAIEDSLRDVDWRVAVEAVRALAGADDAGRAKVATSLARRWSELVKGNATEAQVITEALRQQIGKPITDRAQADAIASLAATAKSDTSVPALTRGWIECLARVAAPASAAGALVDSVTSCGLPDHLRLPLLAEVVTNGLDDANTRRAAMRVLMAHDDPRVRAAGLGALASTWKDAADPRAQQTIVSTVTGAIASKNAVVASAGVDAADALYDTQGTEPFRAALDSALVARAATETDVELVASLYGVIGKRAIASGTDACRAGLSGHPLRAKAAVECLKKLGQAVETGAGTTPPSPPADVADVIGHSITWHLETSRGPIDISLRPDVAPWAVATIVSLTKRGFYDGLELHRVVPNFVAQGGDPTETGAGGPGFLIPAEPAAGLDGPGFVEGGVGMADAGPDSAGSQWFVMHSRAPHLDGRYTWFGSVASGQKSADALLIGDRVEHATVVFK